MRAADRRGQRRWGGGRLSARIRKQRRDRVGTTSRVRAGSAAVALAVVLASCGTSGGTASKGVPVSPAVENSTVLHLAFTADTQPPDPDVFYAGQGLDVTMAAYQGLVQYEAGTSKAHIVADLATRWTISPSGTMYTFYLRKGVLFHDGTTFTSAAVKASFARRAKLGQGPAYMVADVASVDTSNPYVAVVHLTRPVSAFMDYLASPYGPKMESPTALAAHAGTDNAQSWLRTHDVGTGPYYISSATPGQQYTLSEFPKYWGPKPYYKVIHIAITPDVSTQELQLQRNQIQLIQHGLSTTAITSFRSNPKFRVVNLPTLQLPMIWVNPNKGIFKSHVMRTALAAAIDRSSLVSAVFPGRATVARQIYPRGELPMGTAMDDPAYDPARLKALVARSARRSVTLGYSTSQPSSLLLANLIQAELASTGLSVTVRGIPSATIYAYPGNPTAGPDLLVETNWPDAAHPDTWARIVMGSGGGLNYLTCRVPAGDAQLNKGLYTTDQAASQKAYETAGSIFAASGCWDPIANLDAVVVAPKWLRGIRAAHQVVQPYALDLASLHPASASTGQ